MSVAYPRVSIEFCTKCRWNLRAAWYLQELLSTFGQDLGEVALIPGDGGVFKVHIQQHSGEQPVQLWDRKARDGFPDSKELKQLVRNVISPQRNLGHSEKKGGFASSGSAPGPGDSRDAKPSNAIGAKEDTVGTQAPVCEDCQ